jgi:hypothetical protein
MVKEPKATPSPQISVVLTAAQIQQIATHWANVYFVNANATATLNLADLENAVSNVSVSISIGGGSVSMSPSFPPPFNSQPAAAQDDLISYIIQVATGVPLVG